MFAGLLSEAEVSVVPADLLLEQFEVPAERGHGRDEVVGEGSLQ
ncbi:hypothetical protein [Microbacterium sp. MM2322]